MTSIYGVRPSMTHRGWSLWQRPLMMPVVLSERSDARVALTFDARVALTFDARVALTLSCEARVALTFDARVALTLSCEARVALTLAMPEWL
jgi:hypothetical protein